METKIVKLITGEELITKISEIKDTEGNQIGFKLIFPYRIVMRPIAEQSETKFDINYLSWMSSSGDLSFDVTLSAVITIGDPLPEVAEMYAERYNEIMNGSQQ